MCIYLNQWRYWRIPNIAAALVMNALSACDGWIVKIRSEIATIRVPFARTSSLCSSLFIASCSFCVALRTCPSIITLTVSYRWRVKRGHTVALVTEATNASIAVIIRQTLVSPSQLHIAAGTKPSSGLGRQHESIIPSITYTYTNIIDITSTMFSTIG